MWFALSEEDGITYSAIENKAYYSEATELLSRSRCGFDPLCVIIDCVNYCLVLFVYIQGSHLHRVKRNEKR